MHKEFTETFVSPFLKDTEEEAKNLLEEIRESHPASSGWEEIKVSINLLPNGKYQVIRQHKKIYA